MYVCESECDKFEFFFIFFLFFTHICDFVCVCVKVTNLNVFM